MVILISPSKTLKFTPTSFNVATDVPPFLDKSVLLADRLKMLDVDEIAQMMAISSALARLNFERFQQWSLPFTDANATPALWTFMGDVYEGLNASSFSKTDAEVAQATIRILSGLYGVLRPFDLMQPYRLEMGIKLSVDGKPNLYKYWDRLIVDYLAAELAGHPHPVVVNLASQEYFKAVESISKSHRVVTPTFYETASGKPTVVAIHAKRARGLMARFAVKERIAVPEHIKAFSSVGYCFSESLSRGDSWAFVR